MLLTGAFLLGSGHLASGMASKKNNQRHAVIQSITPQFREDFQKFCFYNADAVQEARFVWQAKLISRMEERLKKLIKRLEVRQAEYKKWVKRREDFISKATDTLVSIYTAMDPEVAATQIAQMDYDTALSILIKLKPRDASAIMNELEPKRAGQLVKVIVGAAMTNENDKETK